MALRFNWDQASRMAVMPLYPIYWLFTDEWDDFSLKRIGTLAAVGGAFWGGLTLINNIDEARQAEAAQTERITKAAAPSASTAANPNTPVVIDHISYRLTGINTAEARDGEVRYSFNYSSEFAHIDGPDSADGLVKFNDLPNNDYRDNAKRVACAVGKSHIETRQPANSVPVLFYRAHC